MNVVCFLQVHDDEETIGALSQQPSLYRQVAADG